MQLSEHFGAVNGNSRSERERLQRQFIQQRELQKRQDKKAEQAEDDFADFMTVAASQTQIAQFEVKLDGYDEAIVVALMENQRRQDEVRASMAVLLEQAYVLEDGRRVFKTEDGTQVFDEHGSEVSSDELDFDLITPDRHPWQSYRPLQNELSMLEVERVEIFEFQEQVDAARERVADGDISEAKLEELDADLLDGMPPSVRSHVAGLEPPVVAVEMELEKSEVSARQSETPQGANNLSLTSSSMP